MTEEVCQLVAFLDCLGTKRKVLDGEYNAYNSLDFINAAGIAAQFCPNLKFAAFSDSVVVSSSIKDLDIFVRAVSFLYRSWISDGILIRGGVAFDQVTWLDHPPADRIFGNLENFSYVRLFGPALIKAINLESNSGKGASIFLSDEASDVVRKMLPNAVVEYNDLKILSVSDLDGLPRLYRAFSEVISGSPSDSDMTKQISSTCEHLNSAISNKKFLPEGYSTYESLVSVDKIPQI